MKSYALFNYDYLFNDYFSQISNEARLLYIKMNFFAVNGFVTNPLEILDSLNYDKGVLQELINIGEVLTLEGRSEVFITSYFIHNKGINKHSWKSTPYAIYWKKKLNVKKNGVATMRPLRKEEKDSTTIEQENVENVENQTIAVEERHQLTEEEQRILDENIRIAKTPWLD